MVCGTSSSLSSLLTRTERLYDDKTAESPALDRIDEILKVHSPPGACYGSLTTNIITPLMRFHSADYSKATVSAT
jgi:hypothetical protein